MRKIILATAFALVSSAAFAGTFSAQLNGDSSYTVGGFRSFAQCQAFVSGLNGTCMSDEQSWTNAQARYLSPVKVQPVETQIYNTNQP